MTKCLYVLYVMNGGHFNALPFIVKFQKTLSMFSDKMLETDPVWKVFIDQTEYSRKISCYPKNKISGSDWPVIIV